MRNRPLLFIAGASVLLLLGAVGYYLASPLFIDNRVDDAFPFAVPDRATLAAMDAGERAALESDFMAAMPDEATLADLPPAAQAELADTVQGAAAVVMMDKAMADAMPADQPVLLAEGAVMGADDFHKGSGHAALYQLPDGEHLLRFEDFSVTNGPDLHVLLVRHPNPTSRADVGDDYVDLGSLKGNLGDQNYVIPDGIDVSQYQSVVVYCVPFHVLFATAPLG